jgi:dTDP-4-amino-4,6-dideoxygalactose transaminase
MMPVPKGVYPNYWLSCLTFDDPSKPAEIMAKLNAENIHSRPIWKPIHMQPYYQHCDFITAQPDGSMGEELFKSGLCLPSDLNMSLDECSKVVAIFGR